MPENLAENAYLVEAVDFDNRSGEGPEGIMFGFVYFNDGRRVAYATGHGVTDGTGGWAKVTAAHQRLATRFLNRVAPGWNNTPEKETATS